MTKKVSFLNFVFMKRTVEEYLSRLLFRFDAVSVHGFGVFESEHFPARYLEKTGSFEPPHKEIRFRFLPEIEDSLLIEFIATAENISTEKARNILDETVTRWKNTLHEKNSLELEGIGHFMLINGKLFFHSTNRNFLADAFGLKSFTKRKIKQNEIRIASFLAPENEKQNHKPTGSEPKKTVPKPTPEISKPVFSDSKKTVLAKRSPLWQYAAAAVIGGALFLSLYLNGNTPVNQPGKIPVYQATYELPGDFPVIRINTNIQSGNNQTASIVQNKPDKENRIAIIAGAFRSKTNAEKMLRRLQSAGYPASITGQNRKGYWLVAYQTFLSRNEAEAKLSVIKRKVNPYAWIKE